MSLKKIIPICLLVFFPFFTSAKEKISVKDTLSINFRLNTKSDDGKNFLKWSTSSKKISDKYDAVSGASLSHSTGGLFETVYDTSSNPKKLLAPKGLRALLLFAVSSPEFLKSDNLQTFIEENGKTTVTFTHRGADYFIQTDEKGKLDVEKSFFIINQENGGNSEKEKTEQKKAEAEISDEKPEQEDSELEKLDEKSDEGSGLNKNDEKSETETSGQEKLNEKSKYKGTLRLKLENDILTIKGKLKLVELTEENSENKIKKM